MSERSWGGDIAEVAAYDRDLTPAERAAIIGYLVAKYRLPVHWPAPSVGRAQCDGAVFSVNRNRRTGDNGERPVNGKHCYRVSSQFSSVRFVAGAVLASGFSLGQFPEP